MFMHCGIAVDTWVKIAGGCPIRWEVAGGEARFEIGPEVAVLNLVASEQGLQELIAVAADALRAIQAPDGQRPDLPSVGRTRSTRSGAGLTSQPGSAPTNLRRYRRAGPFSLPTSSPRSTIGSIYASGNDTPLTRPGVHSSIKHYRWSADAGSDPKACS